MEREVVITTNEMACGTDDDFFDDEDLSYDQSEEYLPIMDYRYSNFDV